MSARRLGLGIIAAAGLTLAAGAPALALTDAKTGLAVEPPAPFKAEVAPPGIYDAAFGITSTTGQPPVAGRTPVLCKIGYRIAFRADPIDQAEMNRRYADEGWRKGLLGDYKASLTITAQEVIEEAGVAGVELTATPRGGPNASEMRVHITILETPKGRMVQTCATPAVNLEAAIPEFRRIRASITLPK
jgi:protein TonB